MRGIALSDLHLCKSQFSAMKNGRNLREQDIEDAWFRAVDVAIAQKPDLISIAGDVFDHTRPSFHAVRAFQQGIRKLVRDTGAHIVIIPGNHEGGRTAAALTPIIVVEGDKRVHVVTEPMGRVHFDIGRTVETCCVTCLPFNALAAEQVLALNPWNADINVLLVHAAVNTSADGAERLPMFYAGIGTLDIGLEALRWDVIAAGDYHSFHRLHPTRLAFYSGAIERTSSNIWDEADQKGVVLYDTDTQEMELLVIDTRGTYTLDFHDLTDPMVDACAENVNHILAELGHGIDNAMVRFVVKDFPREDRNAIDWRLVRDLQARCFHFQLDLRFAARETVFAADRRSSDATPLHQAAADFFAAYSEPVRKLALELLEAA